MNGCCIARYGEGGGAGGGRGIYRMTEVEKIMLKFRPIAPKPVTASGGSTAENSDGGYLKCGRSKRKYVRVVNKNKKKNNSSKNTSSEKMKVKTSSPSSSPSLVTLSLLPETPDRKESATDHFSDLLINNNKKKSVPAPSRPGPVLLSFEAQEQKACYDYTVVMKPQVVSYVKVECVTDTWADVEGLGCTDGERMMNMEKDTSPGFISDGQDKVVWTNMAFRQMVGVDADMAVVLVKKDIWSSPLTTYSANFSCKVRVTTSVVESHRRRQTPPTVMLPCDVWRMECGACAWRLDVKAALSLGQTLINLL